jgi:serine/threonine protein kinase
VLDIIIIGFVSEGAVEELLKECVKMRKFDHPNVLTLTGVCLDGGPAPYIIMPFMENGSLLSYLKKERDSLVLEPGSTDVVRKFFSTTCGLFAPPYNVVQI